MEGSYLIITTDRVLLAVVALGFFYMMQRQGRRRSEEYLKRIQEKSHRDLEQQVEQVNEDDGEVK